MTCALLAAFHQLGKNPCAFKCGPDYIDPMFHRAVLGMESHNLDLYLSSPDRAQALYTQYSAGHGAVITEGVMGYYDGLGGTSDQASAWQLADVLRLPVLLVLRPKGASLTLAAAVRGLQGFRSPDRLVGILFNECKPMQYQMLAPMLEKETGLPVLGYLPPMQDACFASRHLGLYTAGEIADLRMRIEALGRQARETVDLARVQQLCRRPERPALPREHSKPPFTRIAVARDEAFCFCYAETLDAFQQAGAEPVFFSPLRDEALPKNCGGLYLPGGYPELYARELSKNTVICTEIRQMVQQGLPTVAECGGYLYLGQTLEDTQGKVWPMAGILPGHGIRTGHLVRFGYAELTAQEDSMLFRAGEKLPIHAFHYWDSTSNGAACTVCKPISGRSWHCGFATSTLFASFAHIYWAGAPDVVRRFVAAASVYERK